MEYVCSYDPTLEKPIFENLMEFEDYHFMIKDIVSSVVKEKMRCIVYVSSTAQGEDLHHKILALRNNDKDLVPMIHMYSSTTVELLSGQESDRRVLDREYDLNIVTSAMGIGASFPQPCIFDRIYMALHFGKDMPQLADMVQLSARIRNPRDKTLRYHMKCSDLPTSMYKNKVLRKVFPSYYMKSGADDVKFLCDSAYALTKAVNMAGANNRDMMRMLTKKALTIGFRFVKSGDMMGREPTYELVTDSVTTQERNFMNRRGNAQRNYTKNSIFAESVWEIKKKAFVSKTQESLRKTDFLANEPYEKRKKLIDRRLDNMRDCGLYKRWRI